MKKSERERHMSNQEKNNAPKKGLGRGLNSLLGESKTEKDLRSAQAIEVPKKDTNKDQQQVSTSKSKIEQELSIGTIESRVWSIPIEKLEPNRDQPREDFNKESLQELASSIKSKGILQPIIVRQQGEKFQIIAGERRWRAAQLANLHEVPAIVRTSGDQDTLELALIENIQRSDLNPIEEARAFCELSTKYSLSHSEIADKVGKERATVTNALRLLGLPEDVQALVYSRTLSIGHAKVLLGLEGKAEQAQLAKEVIEKKMSVRALEKAVDKVRKGIPQDVSESALDREAQVMERLIYGIEQELQKALSTKVSVEYKKSKGKVSVYFYTDDQLTEIAERLKA